MTTEASKALLRRYKTGTLNTRDIEALNQVAAPDYLDHAAFPGQAPGLGAYNRRGSLQGRKAADENWDLRDARDREDDAGPGAVRAPARPRDGGRTVLPA